jgi:nucleotide-binding universal stress UspA family protein
MKKKILIATDGSASAREAVETGLELATEQDAEIMIVHVAPRLDVYPWSGVGVASAFPHELTAADRAPLVEAEQLASERGVDATTELLRGDPIDEIVAYADSEDVDLIVIGSRGHGAFASALLGSVSLGVMHETRRPVLVVRSAQHAAQPAVAG